MIFEAALTSIAGTGAAANARFIFLSRVKENMTFEWVRDHEWDTSDGRNRGIRVDCKVHSREGPVLRLILYQDALSGEVCESDQRAGPAAGSGG